MKFISLFSGVGGFDLGFERAGMECVMQAERDKHCLNVLENHYPTVKRVNDVRQITKTSTAAVDLICGGFPCQDVSVAGRRAGLAGERSGLWFEFLRILHDLKPTWVVIENVPGLLNSNRGRDFATILYGLGKCGYKSGWRILDAQYWGVAQRRRRVFIVGCLGNSGRAAQVLFEQEGGEWHYSPRRKTREATPDLIGTLAASGAGTSRHAGQNNELDFLVPQGYQMSGFAKYTASEVARTIGAVEYKEPSTLVATAIDVRNLRSNGEVSGTLQAKANGYSLNYQNPITVFDANASLKSKQQSMIRKEEYSGTLQADGNVDAIAYAGGVRRLTPLECERLMGFPDSWTNIPGASDRQRYRQMGNAVCVPVAEWLGRRIMKAHQS